MKTLTSKQTERLERKKKKLAALANLVRLNDKDRESTARTSISSTLSDTESFSTNRKVTMTAPELDEPQAKKVKLDSNEDMPRSSESETSSFRDDCEGMKVELTEEQYTQLKKELKERKRQLQNVPKLHLRQTGTKASLGIEQDKRTPIFLTDVQHLLMSALIGKNSPCTPDRWCVLERPLRLSHTLVLVLEGVSLYHYLSNEEKFSETNKIFETKLEIVLPTRGDDSIIQSLATVPLTNVQAEELIDKYGSLEAAVEMTKDPTLHVKCIFPVDDMMIKEVPIDLPEGDKFPRTQLLLSALQMVDEGYPMPLRGELSHLFKDYVFTKDAYAPVTARSPMFGVDCEMCKTSSGQNELTRISIVNENYDTVYETLVLPVNKIVDYLTQYSGITEELMRRVTKRLKDVQREVRALLPPDAILVGQSLNSDLNAMKMMHPYVIDTSVIFNITGQRRRKSKLQTLAMKFLDQAIQRDAAGHDSVEDSLASIRLVQLKLKHNLDFGDEILIQKRRGHQLTRLASSGVIKNNLLGQAAQRDKRTAIIKSGSLHPDVKDLFSKATSNTKLRTILCHEAESNKEAVRKAREIVLENALTITNLAIEPEKFQLERVDKTVAKVDKWIRKLWQSVAHNGLFVVLLGGSEDSPNGLVKIAIKRNVADVANDVPISI